MIYKNPYKPMTTHCYSKGKITIPYGERNIYSPQDLKTGNDISSNVKRELYNTVAQIQGGWLNCYSEYLRNENKISGKGLTDAVKRCLQPDKFDSYVNLKGYVDDVRDPTKPCQTLKTAQQKCFDAICATLRDQWRTKFAEIYFLNTDNHVQNNLFQDSPIDKALNIKPQTVKRNAISKSKLLPIAAKLNELLEPLDEEERNYVLSI